MRQIHVCAWLFLALTACSGEEFAPSGASATAGKGGKGGNGGAAASATYEPPASTSGSSGTAVDTAGGGATTGSAGSGGSKLVTGSGGASPAGLAGEASDESAAGASSADCTDGAVTFRMLPSPDLTPDFLCDAGCGTGWLSITDADGAAAFSIFPACGTASCDSCEVQQCAAAACLPKALTAQGSELVWRGTYLEKDKCGAAGMVCQQQACVKPGKYKARACAALNAGNSAANGGCMPKEEQLCAEVEFEFPATDTVKLMLGR